MFGIRRWKVGPFAVIALWRMLHRSGSRDGEARATAMDVGDRNWLRLTAHNFRQTLNFLTTTMTLVKLLE